MFENLLLHPGTSKRLQAFVKQPAAGLLITGQAGSGKSELAKHLAAEIIGIDAEKLKNYPYFHLVKRPDDKQEIPIDAIRQIIREIHLKPASSSNRAAQRVVVIEEAGRLSQEAQNALLKTLEEPTAATLFILTADSVDQVLSTVASRTQKISVAPVGQDGALSYFSVQYPATAVTSAWQLSQGTPGLLSALLGGDSQHPLKIAVDEAKVFLKQDRYERTLYLESLSSDRQKLTDFLQGLSRVLRALQHASLEGDNQRLAIRLSTARRQVNNSILALRHNTSPRLVGLHLALTLPV